MYIFPVKVNISVVVEEIHIRGKLKIRCVLKCNCTLFSDVIVLKVQIKKSRYLILNATENNR